MSYDSIDFILNDIANFGKENFIIITGGIGDFLTIDYFFSFSSKKNIIFITKQSLVLKNLYNFYNKKNKFYALYFDFSLIGKPGFENKTELLYIFPQFKNIHTVNISEYFPIIKKLITKKTFFKKNIIFNQVNENIKQKYNLPEKFVFIHPYTEDNRINCIRCNFIHKGITNCGLTRNFLYQDYLNIFNFLKNKNITGVIICNTPILIPDMFKNIPIINFSNNKLSIVECFEILKKSKYFFGIDSVFSVIACKILPSENIYIKCNNQHAYNNRDIYWYPKKDINIGSFINIKY